MRARTRALSGLCLFVLLSGALMLPGAPSASAQMPPVDLYYEYDCNSTINNGDQYTYDDTNARVMYQGTWKAERPGGGLYLGTQHITNVGGSTVSFTLPRSSYAFAFGYTKMRNAGKAALYFQNQYVTTIDMYAPTTKYNCVIILYWSVPAGTVTVKALNQKSPESSGTYVNIDYFYYEP